MNYFIFLLIIVIVVIYIYGFISNKEKFVSGYDSSASTNEPVNYDTRKQNCNELTYSPKECVVDTVIPTNKIVCSKSLSPVTNNELATNNKIDLAQKNKKKSKNPTLSLDYDFDLLSSFNNAQLNNNLDTENYIDELKSLDDLKTDVHSLNSIENDLMSNY